MPSQVLNNRFKQILENGFDDEFIIECTEKFENAEFSPQTKATARLYLIYLSGVLKSAITNDILWERVTSQIESFEGVNDIPMKAMKLIKGAGLDLEPRNIALAIGAYCYAGFEQKKMSESEFFTNFVNMWLEYFLKYEFTK